MTIGSEGVDGYARRVALHKLAGIARYAGVEVEEGSRPAPLPPLAPRDPRVIVDIVMMVLEARRSPWRRREILSSLVSWIAANLPPWEARRAPSTPLQPPKMPPRGLKGLISAAAAFSRTPTLESATLLAYVAASESLRPCSRPRPTAEGQGKVRLYAALFMVAVTVASSLLLGPVEALLITISAAIAVAVTVYALEGPWRRAEDLWDSCRITRLQALPLAEVSW